MENSKHAKEGSSETSEKLRRLVQQLMTGEGGTHATFDHVEVDGSNVGAVMCVTCSCSKDVSDPCGVNIYVSNNVQGVNNSILVGSEVKMGEPGLKLSFEDIKREGGKSKAKSSKLLPRLRFSPMLPFVFVLVVSVVFALFGVVSNYETNRFRLLSFPFRERSELLKFAT